MQLVIDSNIVFSAILNSHSNIGQIILNGSKHFAFLVITFLMEEIDNHETRILSISGLSYSEYQKIYGLIKENE